MTAPMKNGVRRQLAEKRHERCYHAPNIRVNNAKTIRYASDLRGLTIVNATMTLVCDFVIDHVTRAAVFLSVLNK